MRWRAIWVWMTSSNHFTLIGDELDLLRNKSGATRLGFAGLLKYVIWRTGGDTDLAGEVRDGVIGQLPRFAWEAPASECWRRRRCILETRVGADLGAVALGGAAREVIGLKLRPSVARLASASGCWRAAGRC